MFYTGDSGPRRISSASQGALDKQSSVAIYLERNSGPYDAGDVIKGHVELDLKKDMKVKGMKLQFSGAARVSLDSEKTTHYKGVSIDKKCKNFELILDHKVQLLKKETNQLLATAPGGRKKSIFSCSPLMEDADSFLIPAGVNKYPFEFILPRTLPSSYDGRWGSIQYGIRLTLEKFNDIERLVPFSVRGLVDLNEDLDLLKPVTMSDCLTYSRCCSCARKNLTINLSVIRRAYVPGEPVRFIAEIVNETHKKLRSVKIALVQQVMFRAGAQSKKSSSALQTFQGGPIGARQSRRWDQETLTVPHDAVPTCVCKSIQIKYVVNVNISMGFMTDDINLPVTLIVGSVQFKSAPAQRHLAKLRQSDPTVQSILGQFAEVNTLLNAAHRESLASLRRSSQTNLVVPGANGRRRSSTGSGYELSMVNNASPVKRQSSAGAKSLTVADARMTRTSNSDLTED